MRNGERKRAAAGRSVSFVQNRFGFRQTNAPIKIMSEKVVKKIKEEIEQTKRALKEKTTTLIIGGFGLVAALAWNEAIKSLFDVYFKESNGLIGKFIYALMITVIVVIVSIRLGKFPKKKNNQPAGENSHQSPG